MVDRLEAVIDSCLAITRWVVALLVNLLDRLEAAVESACFKLRGPWS